MKGLQPYASRSEVQEHAARLWHAAKPLRRAKGERSFAHFTHAQKKLALLERRNAWAAFFAGQRWTVDSYEFERLAASWMTPEQVMAALWGFDSSSDSPSAPTSEGRPSQRTETEPVHLRYGGQWTCTGCPVQAEGRLDSGRPWYFRARHGEWVLRVGEPSDDNAVSSPCVADGLDPWDGFMPQAEAAARIHAGLRWFAPAVAAITGCVGADGDDLVGDGEVVDEFGCDRFEYEAWNGLSINVATRVLFLCHQWVDAEGTVHDEQLLIGHEDQPRCTANDAVQAREGGAA